MVQGVGLQFLSAVLAAVSPTHVVMLQSKAARRNLPSHAFWTDATTPEHSVTKLLAFPGVGSQSPTSIKEDEGLTGTRFPAYMQGFERESFLQGQI